MYTTEKVAIIEAAEDYCGLPCGMFNVKLGQVTVKERSEYLSLEGHQSDDFLSNERNAIVVIYYSDQITINTQILLYTTGNLVADFGGLSGLWLGLSLLTVIDYVWTWIKKLASKQRRL